MRGPTTHPRRKRWLRDQDGRPARPAGGRRHGLGFAFVIQDENVDQLVPVYEMARSMGVELSTSTLHNAWQFYKNDNYFYDRVKVARKVEGLITSMLAAASPRTGSAPISISV